MYLAVKTEKIESIEAFWHDSLYKSKSIYELKSTFNNLPKHYIYVLNTKIDSNYMVNLF